MKKKWRKAAAGGIFFFLLTMQSWASGYGAKYDVLSDTLSIWDQGEQRLAVIRVMPQQLEPEQISAQMVTERGNILYKVQETEGELEVSFGLSDNLPAGRYRVDVFGAADLTDFLVIKPSDEAAEAVEKLNAAETEAEFLQALKEQAKNLGLEAEAFYHAAEKEGAVLFARRPQEGYTVATFMQAYGFYEGIVLCQMDRMEYRRVLEEYLVYNTDTMLDGYLELTEQQKTKVDSAIDKVDFILKEPQDALRELYFLAQIESTQDFIALRDVVISYAQRTGEIDMIGYDRLINQYYRDRVFSMLYGKKEEIMGIQSLQALLNACIDDIENQQSQQGDGGSGGGGSAGGGNASGTTAGDFTYTPVQEERPEQRNFSDISGHWAEEKIQSMQQRGWIDGFEDGTFRPDDTITRAEFTKLIVEIDGLLPEGDCRFLDVKEGEWFYPYIAKAVEKGLVMGLSEDMFGPNEPISRQDAAVLAYRLAEKMGLNLSGSYTFEDMADVSDYAKEAVEVFGAQKLLQGYQNRFQPQESITRAETAVLLANIMDRKEAAV